MPRFLNIAGRSSSAASTRWRSSPRQLLDHIKNDARSEGVAGAIEVSLWMESKKAWQGEPDPPSQYSSNLERKGRPMNVHIGQSRLPSKGLVPAWLDDVKVSVFEVCNAQINSADTLAKANPEDRH